MIERVPVATLRLGKQAEVAVGGGQGRAVAESRVQVEGMVEVGVGVVVEGGPCDESSWDSVVIKKPTVGYPFRHTYHPILIEDGAGMARAHYATADEGHGLWGLIEMPARHRPHEQPQNKVKRPQ